MSAPLTAVFVAFAHVEAPTDAPNRECLGVYTMLKNAQARVALCNVDVEPPTLVWQEDAPGEWSCWERGDYLPGDEPYPLGFVERVQLDGI